MTSATLVQQQRCEYIVSPDEIETKAPRLSWTILDHRRCIRQTAFQVLVASADALLVPGHSDLWDSGRVSSDRTVGIRYAGRALVSRQRCYWKVRVWDQDGKPSNWSSTARWTMGLLRPADWTARWIMAPPQPDPAPALPIFRKEFDVRKPLRRATIYFCGLGQYELRLNGRKVGETLLDPGWTDYKKTCLYRSIDLTTEVRVGPNAIGVLLGNGMYNVDRAGGRYAKFVGSTGPLKLIAQLEIDYADGSRETIDSDDTWKSTAGPITLSSIYGGEDYDARQLETGWDTSGFDASRWSPAVVTEGPGGALRGSEHSGGPIKVIRTLDPIKITDIKPGVAVYDLGQNGALIPRIAATGPRGAAIRIIPGERLNPDGTVSQHGSGAPAYYTYIMRGAGLETWSPRFSYYGSRYFQIECSSGSDSNSGTELPQVQSVRGLFISSAPEPSGEFVCSNDMFNRTAAIIDWAMRSNMMSILTDCPHRERLGWLEQVHLVGPSMMYRFDSATLMTKTVADMADAQCADGLIPDIAPEFTVFSKGFRDSPEWGSAYLIVPYNLYRWYGDVEVLRENYPGMKRYVDYLGSKAKDGILSYGLGDWYDIGPKPPGYAQLTPPALTATAFYLRDINLLKEVAALLGNQTDIATYSKLSLEVRMSFNDKFYNADLGAYATGSQTSNAIPLAFDLVDPPNVDSVRTALVRGIRAGDNRLTAGDIGFRYLIRALADSGRSDVIFDMNCRSDRPGYGWMLDHGATTLTEAWNADPNSSLNHFMLGHIQEWFYGDLAGIQQAADSVAFQKIVIKPSIVGDVTWVNASYCSVAGNVVSRWKIDGDKFKLAVEIPANTTATIYIPNSDGNHVTEGGLPGAKANGVKFVGMNGTSALFSVGSGSYNFESPYTHAPSAR